jgi:integrase
LSAAPARVKPLATYLDDYARSRALSTKSGSAEQLSRHARTFKAFAEVHGITSIQGVTRVHCREYLEERIRSVAHSTLTTERGYLMGAWSQAVHDGLLVVNPWSSVDVPGKAVDTPPTFWSSEEIGKIAAACGKEWQRDLVLVLANTGLRISTGLALAWDWIDWGEGEITIPLGVEDVKTSYPLSMGRVARDVLQRRNATSKGSPLVFPNPLGDGGVIHYDTARAAIDRAIKRAEVKHGTPHDLRHSCARNMILAGVPITIVQRQLGHTTLAMTQRYCSADAKTSRGYLEVFGLGDGSG